MKVQPVGDETDVIGKAGPSSAMAVVAPPAATRSRLRRLFLRISSSEKLAGAGAVEPQDPGSVALDKMVRSFLEEPVGPSSAAAPRCGRNRCNCFHGQCADDSDDDHDAATITACLGDSSPPVHAADIIKSLVLCASTTERNLLADVTGILEKNKSSGKRKNDLRRLVADALVSAGHAASLCKSRWEKTPTFPAGEYEYLEVMSSGGTERILVDVDFRSEFEIARPTKAYHNVIQSLPVVFVGKEDRLEQIVAAASDAARQSLKKKGLHVAPWRSPEYMRAKWLSPCERLSTPLPRETSSTEAIPSVASADRTHIVGTRSTIKVVAFSPPPQPVRQTGGARVVAGLASVLRDRP